MPEQRADWSCPVCYESIPDGESPDVCEDDHGNVLHVVCAVQVGEVDKPNRTVIDYDDWAESTPVNRINYEEETYTLWTDL